MNLRDEEGEITPEKVQTVFALRFGIRLDVAESRAIAAAIASSVDAVRRIDERELAGVEPATGFSAEVATSGRSDG